MQETLRCSTACAMERKPMRDNRLDKVMGLIEQIDHEMRWPTLKWLLSDVFGVVDWQATKFVDDLIKEGKLQQNPGGWITIVKQPTVSESD